MSFLTAPVGFSGRYRMVVSKDAECQDVVGDLEFNNIITDVGLERWGSVSTTNSDVQLLRAIMGRFCLGAGSGTPSATDTSLDSQVVYAPGDFNQVSSSSSYALGYVEMVVSYQFGQGVAQGNLSEIGLRSGATGPLFSRALILDALGNPTTITVTSSDFLTCYYTFRINIPQEDVVYNINVDLGTGGIVPTVVTVRPLGANHTDQYGWRFIRTQFDVPNGGLLRGVSTGLLAPTTHAPAGGVTIGSTSHEPYVPGSLELWNTATAGLNGFNSSNISTIYNYTMMGAWQFNFDPPLSKDNTQIMTIRTGYTWGRA